MNKKIKCKTCGAEIAKTAKRCPACGAQQHQGALIACSLIIVLTIFLCGFVLIRTFSGSSANPDGATSAAAPVAVTAQDLYTAYEENEVAADKLYAKNILSVSGTVKEITKDLVTEKPCVILDSGDALGIYGIQCFFTDDTQTDAVSALTNGQSVTITGKCSGKKVVIQMTDCSIAA